MSLFNYDWEQFESNIMVRICFVMIPCQRMKMFSSEDLNLCFGSIIIVTLEPSPVKKSLHDLSLLSSEAAALSSMTSAQHNLRQHIHRAFSPPQFRESCRARLAAPRHPDRRFLCVTSRPLYTATAVQHHLRRLFLHVLPA